MIISLYTRSLHTFDVPVDVSLDHEVVYSPENEEYVIAFHFQVAESYVDFLRFLSAQETKADTEPLVFNRVKMHDGKQELDMVRVHVEMKRRGTLYFFAFSASECNVEAEMYEQENDYV